MEHSIRISTNIIDRIALGTFDRKKYEEYMGKHNLVYPALFAERILHDLIEKAKTEWDSFFDFGFSVSFIPRRDKILCLLYAEQKAFIEFWRNLEDVEEYAYWDNTDEPEDIDYEDWKARGKEWDDALKNKFVPAFNSLSFDPATDRQLLVFGSEMEEKQIPFEDRVDNIVVCSLEEDFYSIEEEPTFSSLKKWKETEEYKKEYDKRYAEVSGKLKQKLDSKDFTLGIDIGEEDDKSEDTK